MKKSYIIILLFLAVIVAVGYPGYLYVNTRFDLPLLKKQIETVKTSSTAVGDTSFFLAVMEDYGFDKKNHIKLELILSSPGELERKLDVREEGVEIALYSPISLTEKNIQGQDLRMFAPILNNYWYLTVKKDSPHKSLADLRGKKIAIRPKATAAYKALAMAMKMSGLDLEKDFNLMFATLPESMEFLTTGQADATLLTTGQFLQLYESGSYRVASEIGKEWEKNMGFPMPFVGLAAHQDWIEKNPKKMKRLREAALDTAKYINENPEVIRQYKDRFGLKTEEGLKYAIEVLPRVYPTSWNLNLHHSTIDKAIEFGVIQNPKNLNHREYFIK